MKYAEPVNGGFSIRAAHLHDADALREVCAKTASAGSDASGVLSDDALWGDTYAVPYLAAALELCEVVTDRAGSVVGYLVAAADSRAFYDWFFARWWPESHPEIEPLLSRPGVFAEASKTEAPKAGSLFATFPAHLHINLLPKARGRGLGRILISRLEGRLRDASVRGLHLGVDPRNAGAKAFYESLGFEPLGDSRGTLQYGKLLSAGL